jgi:glyoxylase-like metal-dependent hydrolase (beta-lactamase superfamily II)
METRRAQDAAGPAEWHRRAGMRYIASLAAAACAPDDVDTVMCTHLHADHVGWNTRLNSGRWVVM